jgi:hypothetical protein
VLGSPLIIGVIVAGVVVVAAVVLGIVVCCRRSASPSGLISDDTPVLPATEQDDANHDYVNPITLTDEGLRAMTGEAGE